MILPSKHIKIAESIVGLGGVLLAFISKRPCTIDELWIELQRAMKKELKGAYHSFDSMVLALDFLYLTGVITVNDKGELHNAIVKAQLE